MPICKVHNVAFGGDGVGKIDRLAVFIPFTLPGEVVEVDLLEKKKNFARAKLEKILEPSPNRVSPPCPYFSSCGGCSLQHASYDLQLQIKRQFIEDALTRIGKVSFPTCLIEPSSQPFGYRRHISLKAKQVGNTVKIGFIGVDGHSLTAIDHCLLFSLKNDEILSKLEQALNLLGKELLESKTTVKLIKQHDSSYLALFSFSIPIDKARLLALENHLDLIPTLSSYILNTPDLTLKKGDTSLFFSYQDLEIEYSAFGFVQNHAKQSEKIYDWIQTKLLSSLKVLDLYCGVGVSSLALAKQGKKVLGIESNPTSIEMAQKNAERNHLAGAASFLCDFVEKAIFKTLSSLKPDAVIINPPKAGSQPEILLNIADSTVEKIVYISCNPTTLARDLALLCEKGFKIEELRGFDMFPQTTHVETVVYLKRTS
jgi:23S rRNA (uracil1939-C5)-methyltransferase